jgi:hypothetical protein
MALDDFEMPWPQKGDDPRALGGDWWHNACLNYMKGDGEWSGYTRGYKMAGDICVAYVEQTHNDQDLLVYPILFNYRQYIELSLKTIIRDSRRLLDEQGDFPETHNLLDLWNTAKPLLLRVNPQGDRADIRNVESCLRKFDELDPTSQSFRYPVNRGGAPSLPEELTHLNLRQVRDVVDRLGGFLDSADAMLGAYLDTKAEMDAEYRSEMEADA